MAWAVREHSKGEIDRAGEALKNLSGDDLVHEEEVLAVVNNWRSCHGYPLQAIKMTLLRRAKRIDDKALIAQRLKRLPSIVLKLKDNSNMKLSQMQDIGGCRAVLPYARAAEKLVAVYEKYKSKNPHDRPVLTEKYDYISDPKEDGYRSVHLIYKYQSKTEAKTSFNGQRIEIQIRSQLQHAWATAVETSQTFTGQALKSKIKTASAAWVRFFALMGSAIAMRERRRIVPGTPENRKELVDELRAIADQEKIVESLQGWDSAMHYLEDPPIPDARAFLLVLDPTQMNLRITPFKENELANAQDSYLKLEKETGHDPRIQVVLVSVDSVDALRRAYPNYYVDSSAFISAILREISVKVVRQG